MQIMIPRTLKNAARKAFREYPIVTLTGPRQSGKTTFARHEFDLPYVNLEAPDVREFALKDPRGLLASHSEGAIIDEIQRAPELTSYLQVAVDESSRRGQFLLTGSHNFAIREQLGQTLAGRTALLTLLPFSHQELGSANLAKRDYASHMVTGGYPRVYDAGLEPTTFYRDYVGTYLERDLRQLTAVRDISQFQTFMRLCAASVGQVVNLNRMSNDCGVSQTTATEWLSLMEASYVLYRLKPYFANTRKRLVKRPKLYFYDTGVACFLLGILSSEHLASHPLRGAVFENAIINEILKFDLHRNRFADLSFYRDSIGNEVDLIYRRGQLLIPIEIKSGQTISADYFKGLDYFTRNLDAPPGVVVYSGSEAQRRSDGRSVIPVGELGEFLERMA